MPKIRVAAVGDIEEGTLHQVEAGDGQILLVRTQGRIRALGAHCTHQHAPLADGLLHGHRLVCPWHQAVFDVTSGELLEPPALDCLPTFPVEISGDDVLVEVPDEPPFARTPEMAEEDGGSDGRTVVVLGAGSAGVAAAQELRRAGFAGRVVMVTEDERAPYDRTHCSKGYLSGEAPAEWMPVKPAEFFVEAGIEKVVGRVDEVDLAERRVTLPGGSSIQADGLLLATGGVPRRLDVPGADLDHVFTLRTWTDADAIVAAAGEASHAVVVGASFIGMEVASSLLERGVTDVAVVAPESVPFEHTLGTKVGGWLNALHGSAGVRFALGRQVERFEGEGAVSAVVLDDGSRLQADLVVLGVGVRPATDIVRGVELQPDGSLLTDELLRVCEGVYAAGDIVTFPDWRTGEPVRIEHWRTAAQQGMVAARNLAGEARPYHAVPFFWSMQHGTPLGYVGHAAEWDEEIEHGSVADGDFVLYYVRGGRVLAAAGAGARGAQLNAVHELMQLDRMPSPDELRGGEVDLRERLGSA